MKQLMVKTRIALFTLLILGTISGINAQKVTYKVVNDAPYSNFLNIEISPMDFRFQEGSPLMGPSLMAEIHPISRVIAEVQLGSYLYSPSKGTVNTGIKKMGGLTLDAGGSFAWLRKGINMTKEKGDKTPMTSRFRLKTRGNVET